MLITTMSQNPRFQMLLRVLAHYIKSVVHFTTLISIWICSVFLAMTLKRNAQTRESKFGQVATNVSEIWNKRVVKTVLLMATAYLVFSTPKTITNIVKEILDTPLGTDQYISTYMIAIVVSVQINLFNSSVNIFIYMYTSSKFREIIKQLLCLWSLKQ